MKLFNLTYQDNYYASCLKPTTLPEENYTFIEINYSKSIIHSIKGYYKYDIEKECILSNLDISSYMEKIDSFLKTIDKDKIYINFVENVSDDDERIRKIFIILLSSYLIYFNFLDFPYEISLDLLTNKMFIYFTSFTPINPLEISFKKQVSTFHRYFSKIFENEDQIDEGIKKINDEVDKLVSEINEYKRKFIKDNDLKEIKKDLANIKSALKKLSDI